MLFSCEDLKTEPFQLSAAFLPSLNNVVKFAAFFFNIAIFLGQTIKAILGKRKEKNISGNI